MQIEFDTSHRTFESLPNNSVFIWETNGKVYAKKDCYSAIDLEAQTEEEFGEKDEVTPYIIEKIILK